MPTLTPKKNRKAAADEYIPTPSASTGSSNPSTTKGANTGGRFEYLDSLRGILSLVVVLHHFRCGFQPCQVFGTADWLRDITLCEHADTGWNLYLGMFTNGTFAVAVFLVISGFVLSNGLWKAGAEPWRLAIAKRYLRLGLPCGAALMWGYVLAGWSFHTEASAITQSIWLSQLGLQRPSPVTGLLAQMAFGAFHGNVTLNNSLWVMPIELLGSFLVFLLVAMLKGSPHKIRTRWLAALTILLMLPTPKLSKNFTARVSYDIVNEVAIPGRKKEVSTQRRFVDLDLYKHAHVLHDMHVTSKTHTTTMEFRQEPIESWFYSHEKIDSHVFALDHPKKKQKLTNSQVYRELLAAADPADTNFGNLKVEVLETTSWRSSSSPWLWYSAFVAGVWISEYTLMASSGRKIGMFSLRGTPFVHYYFVFALVAGTMPLTQLLASKYMRWRLMYQMAASIGLTGASASFFWSILGAVALVFYTVIHGKWLQKLLISQPILQMLGKLSYSLYLTHIPILYTFSSFVFVQLHSFFDENETVAYFFTTIASLPIMLGVAFLFYKYVDHPSIEIGNQIARTFLGMPPLPKEMQRYTEISMTNNTKDEPGRNDDVPIKHSLSDPNMGDASNNHEQKVEQDHERPSSPPPDSILETLEAQTPPASPPPDSRKD
jgi:peptidoglycan/LPS O-acetylase OafA/YrhL